MMENFGKTKQQELELSLARLVKQTRSQLTGFQLFAELAVRE